MIPAKSIRQPILEPREDFFFLDAMVKKY